VSIIPGIDTAAPVGDRLAVRHVRAASVRCHGEAGRDGDPELRHLGQADAFSAEQLAPALGRLVEVVDEAPVGSHCAESSHAAPDEASES